MYDEMSHTGVWTRLDQACSESAIAELEARFLSVEDAIRRMDSPVALVGNGPLREEWGRTIDSHITVIRMNACRIAGFERFCGSKTTHWVTSANPAYKPVPHSWIRRGRRALRRRLGSVAWDDRELLRPEFGINIPTLVPRPYHPDRALALRTYFGRDRELYSGLEILLPYSGIESLSHHGLCSRLPAHDVSKGSFSIWFQCIKGRPLLGSGASLLGGTPPQRAKRI
jgi:hypothetical protein